MSASSSAEAVPVAVPAEGWSRATRLAFRFSFVFLLLFTFPFPLNLIPNVGALATKPWEWIVPVVAQSLFGVKADVLPNGTRRSRNSQQLIHTVPACRSAATRWARCRSRVQTVAESP